jgi:tetratricopeptide (TPR) repeat protein
MYGRTLNHLSEYALSIMNLKKAIEESNKMKSAGDIKEKRGSIFIELGNLNSKLAYQMINSGKIEKDAYHSLLQKSIQFFDNASSIWKELKSYPNLITSETLIGGSFEVLNDLERAKEHYNLALEAATFSNDVASKFYIYKQLIQIYSNLEEYEVLIRELDLILHETVSVAFMDLFTVAGFHEELGSALINLGRETEALTELLIALNTYKKLSRPTAKILDVLNSIISIYTKRKEQDHIAYYKEQIARVQEELESALEEEKIALLEVIKELWIFSDESVGLFSYTPQTKSNPELISGFLSAMQNFGSELNLQDIKIIKIGENVFAYYREDGLPFFIVGRTSMRFQEKLIKKILRIINRSFWENYKIQIQKFDGETEVFDNFTQIISNMENLSS